MSGIYISKGTTLTLSNISFQIGANGEVKASPICLHVHFDVGPTWIQIANKHLVAARESRARRESVWGGSDETEKANSLEQEFESSMQAIMAAAIAWDSVYAVLREQIVLPPSLLERWRTGRTARYTQVAEVVRRAFSLKPKGAAILRTTLKEIYRYRDLAVHPSGKTQAPILHPELNVGVEWRFVFFRATNAEIAVLSTAAMLWDLAHDGKAKEPKTTEYQKNLVVRLHEIYPNGVPTVHSPNSQSVD
jgi:hypothetical protein